MEEGWAVFITWAGLADELAVEVEERQTGRARQGALLQRAEAAPRSPSLSPMRAPLPAIRGHGCRTLRSPAWWECQLNRWQ